MRSDKRLVGISAASIDAITIPINPTGINWAIILGIAKISCPPKKVVGPK